MFEKSWFRSKKFIAFLLMEILLSALALIALYTQPALGWPLSAYMTCIVFTMGAIAFGFNGQQAALDKYLRGMVLAQRSPGTPVTLPPPAPKDDEI